ncbi:MAG: GNAT family N-acetyltransferase [Candidatus Margulisbacteria bacterium]|nr:GNAT family N-acetyltransferase [Candidatus Margulisiibacteriota bacterium]
MQTKLISVKVTNNEQTRNAAILRAMNNGMSVLLAGTSLNEFNHKIISYLLGRIDLLQYHENSELETLKDWSELALMNQEYCSPAHTKYTSLFQGGVLNLPGHVKYLRSEINTSLFGDDYDRNVVLIRSGSVKGFQELAARYIVMASAKKISGPFPYDDKLVAGLHKPGASSNMNLINLRSTEEFSNFIDRFKSILKMDTIRSSVYLRSDVVLPTSDKNNLKQLILKYCSQSQIIIEEPYDPFGSNLTTMRKVTFIHDDNSSTLDTNGDQTRYQLLQDSASMGYRPTLGDVVEHYSITGRLKEILNTTRKTEDTLLHLPANGQRVKNNEDYTEFQRTYQVLIDTIKPLIQRLKELPPGNETDEYIRQKTLEEIQQLEKTLEDIKSQESPLVRDVSFTFHSGYYRLRTLIQYSSLLINRLQGTTVDELDRRIGLLEHSLYISTNSGMTAARATVMELESVGEVYTTPHYWEIDFLLENIFKHNPHYPNIPVTMQERMITVPAGINKEQIEDWVETILKNNSRHPTGQLLCLDNSISPFFHTESFDLLSFCRYLDIHSMRITNPVYLMVDNTLDFAGINAQTLFPNGIPDNVFLFFTPSYAKLHQLGLDLLQGGAISIHCSDKSEDQNTAHRLFLSIRSRLNEEGTRQNALSQQMLINTYFQRLEENQSSQKRYLDFMVRKRQRNTIELNKVLTEQLGEFLVKDPYKSKRFNYQDQSTGQRFLNIKDPKDMNIVHKVSFAFHYDPDSCIHSYFEIMEEPTDRYIAGQVFDEIKRRIFEEASAQGIHIADGTSWGFVNTRMDWYMHTLRIAVGLEHRENLDKLGRIIASILQDLFTGSDDFLFVAPLTKSMMESPLTGSRIMELDKLIPQPQGQEKARRSYYLREETGKWEFSQIAQAQGIIAGMMLAYQKTENGEPVIYVSKTAVDNDYQGMGLFKKMLIKLKQRAKQQGIKRIILETSASPKNDWVVQRYARSGFKVYDYCGEIINKWPLIKVKMELRTDEPDNVRILPPACLQYSDYQAISESNNPEEALRILNNLRKKVRKIE